jgi:hypothetical protein
VSGTTPTLNVRIQQGIRDGAADTLVGSDVTGAYVFHDFATYTQVTVAAKKNIVFVGGSSQEYAVVDGSLAAATIRSGPLGAVLRAQWTIGGTNPSFTFYIVLQLIP